MAAMRRLLLLCPCLLLGAPRAQAAAAARTIAVSYFDNNTGQADLQPLAKGLADMLITDLGGLPAVRIVERQKLNAALAELDLSRSKFIDPKTAVKLGKGLAAEYIMTGGYALVGGTLRIDVRVFKVDTGQVVASEKVEGKKEQFFALEKELVDVLVGALELKLGRGDKVKLHANPTQSFEAWSSYSAGLDAADRGDTARAQKLYEQALAADPGYAAARTALERLQAMFAHDDKATEALADAELTALDPKAKDFSKKVEDLLLRLDWTNGEQSKRKTTLLLWLGQRGLLACTKTAGPAPGSPHILNDGVPAGGVISHCRQAHEVLLIANEFLDDPTEWDHLARVCENLMRRLPDDRALSSYCRNTIVPGIADAKAKPEDQNVHQAPRMKAMLAAYAAQN
jgi:TolB-like protein